jgi:hypothetical protein
VKKSLVIIFLIVSCLAFGDTIVATSASQADVQTAINAASAGDTVILPASGSSTWTTYCTISAAITIDGNSSTLTAGAVMTYGFFYYQSFTSTALTRITNFTFDLVNNNNGAALAFTSGLSLTNFRLDNNTFQHGGRLMELRGVKGVIDNNDFYNMSTGMLFGTSDALFVEDNNFVIDGDWNGGTTNDQFIDTNNGGKLVIRYNNFDTTALPVGFTGTCWTIQTHGNAAAGTTYGYWQAEATARRGQSVVEIYENTLNGKNITRLATLRGSANLVYNNSITSSTASPVLHMYEEEQYESQFDPLRTAWPAEDQVHNSFFWGNTFNGAAQDSDDFSVAAGSVDYIQEDRDYFLHRPATLAEGMSLGIETFTGANGASGSHPTDGDPHPTEGTMQFTADVENAYYGYTAYTYPHPLRTGADTPNVVMVLVSVVFGVVSLGLITAGMFLLEV